MTTGPSIFRPASAWLARTLVPVLIVMVAARWVGAQGQATPQVTGVVVDEAGSVIPGARVTLTNTTGAVAQTTTTDGGGQFTVRGLEPGTYSVLVEVPLFSPLTESITISPAESPMLPWISALSFK